MPELPEVETIRRCLEKPVLGQTILSTQFTLPRILIGAKPSMLEKKLPGQSIQRIVRRGKYLIFELNRDSLIFHLGMTGQITYAPAKVKEDARFARTVTGLQKAVGVHPLDIHTHAVLFLKNESRVQFRDPRTFGKIFFIPGHDWAAHPRIQKLGPEPLTLVIPDFLSKNRFSQSTRSIKALLLDQTFLAGVGNIYADEALFSACLNPSQSVRTLKPEQWKTLLEEVQKALDKGIRNQGTTFSDYRKPDGTLGRHYEHLLAYGRGGQPCTRCQTPLVKTMVAQRGTVFCPVCQVLIRPGKSHAKALRVINRQEILDKSGKRRHT